MGRGRGLLQKTDLRDHLYLASRILEQEAGLRNTGEQVWNTGPVLDQGDTPQCTAYSAVGLLEADPVVNMTHPLPAEVYALNQANDEWAGTPHDGSSVRAAMKVLQGLGYLTGYAWDFAFESAITWLLNKGPVVFGTIWPDSLMTPKDGWIYVEGNVVSESGHAYMVRGVNTTDPCPNGMVGWIEIQNSWSEDWGNKGRVRMPIEHARILVREGGECAMPTEQLLVPQNPVVVVPIVPPLPVVYTAKDALRELGGEVGQIRGLAAEIQWREPRVYNQLNGVASNMDGMINRGLNS